MNRWLAVAVAVSGLAWGTEFAAEPVRVQVPGGSLSLRLEIDHHLDRGGVWLRERQDRVTGAWGRCERTRMTALALTALMARADRTIADPDPAITAGFAFLLAQLQGEGKGRSAAPVPLDDWVRILPALYFEAERPAVRTRIGQGIAALRGHEFPGWEDEYLRQEALVSAQVLGLVGEEIRAGWRPSWQVNSAADDRVRYLQAVGWAWENRPGADWEAWRDWARSGFAANLRSGNLRLHEAMAKGLQAGRVERVPDGRGGKTDWRERLAVRLFDLQERDGSWIGEPREGAGPDEILETTSRTLLTLQLVVKSL